MSTNDKTMLYLTDLPYRISIFDIQDFLSKYKDDIAKIMSPEMNQRNIIKGKPIAIKVLFKNNESADKCRKEMNLKKLWNKSVRIMWEESNTSLRYNIKNNIFIRGIPKTTTPREVYEYFMQFGDIFSCKVPEDEQGKHKGYGYITYYSNEDAEKALKETKGKKIFDSLNVEIEHFQKKNERMINNNNENNNHKIYINNLPEKYTIAELNSLCKEYGNVLNANIFSDRIGQKFGIVEFTNENEAKDAMSKLNEKIIEKDDKKNKLSVQIYQTQFEHKQFLLNQSMKMKETKAKCNLYIKNIPLTAKEEDLEKVFSKYGEITSIRIQKDKIENKDNKDKIELVSKGFGFISFDKPEEAKKALEEMDQKFLPGFEGWNKPLDIDYHLTKNERQFVDNQDSNIPNYNMNNNQMPFMNNMGPAPPMPGGYGPHMFMPMHPPHFPFPMRFPMMPFNNFMGRGFYHNNFYNKRGGKRPNYKNNNNRNYYNNNKYNKEKEKEKEEILNIENKIDLSEYEKLETDEEKRNYFGEKVYRAIEESQLAVDKKLDSNDIAKITGMIIEIPNEEIIETLQNSNLFIDRIEEALRLLNK
jgi:polyadenylate-binding protein